MDPRVEDIRLLKLAQFYEKAYETFVMDLARREVRDPEAANEIRKLANGADHHGERVAALLARKTAEVSQTGAVELERAALLDILEVERMAREFYMRSFERASDPEVARLLRELARAETRHVRIAERALALADVQHGPPEPGPGRDEETPLWEGTSEPRERHGAGSM